MSDRRHTRGRSRGSDPEPDPYRRTIVALGIVLGLLAFAVIGYAIWSGETTAGNEGANETNETIDSDREPRANETEPAENASGDGGGGEDAGDTQADEDGTSGADGGGNESGGNAEPAPPEDEPAGNGTNETETNGTDETNETGTDGTNETETNETGTAANETNA